MKEKRVAIVFRCYWFLGNHGIGDVCTLQPSCLSSHRIHYLRLLGRKWDEMDWNMTSFKKM